ncbi:unnamed protein product [Blepharisma stoltei]|uniref:ANK_REP_REGION domain-containing protein n=1 Tax=Blepharisma stoltei TaxID=1481888 RepID=A0AAU9JKF3_9CILI|nr:unnamed protein product [Blepharisma stoltei]
MSQLWLFSAQTGNIRQMMIMNENMSHLDINCSTEIDQTALMLASARGFLEIVKFLIEIKADIHHEDRYRENALSLAVWNSHRDIAVLLYKLGSRIHEDIWEQMGEKETKLYEEIPRLIQWEKLRKFLIFSLSTRNSFKLI